MNSMQLKYKIKNIAKDKNVDFNTLLRLYMYDRFLERLSLSKYKDNFILKGGFYLSTLFGVENRNTMDIDAAFRNADFTEDNIVKMIKTIISIDVKDNAKLTYSGISSIRDEDEYGGYRIDLIVQIDNIKEKFHVDIATGDPITPKAITYNYKPILEDRFINLWAYNIETILAEKLETILNRLELNGRMRDYYDIYLICTRDKGLINKRNLRLAIDKTFKKREYNGDINKSLEIIKDSYILKERWNIYAKKNIYAKDIAYKEIIMSINELISVINTVLI